MAMGDVKRYSYLQLIISVGSTLRRRKRSPPLPGFLRVIVYSLASQGTSEIHPISKSGRFSRGQALSFLEKELFIGKDLLGNRYL